MYANMHSYIQLGKNREFKQVLIRLDLYMME